MEELLSIVGSLWSYLLIAVFVWVLELRDNGWRFSLRGMFIVTLAVALVAAIIGLSLRGP